MFQNLYFLRLGIKLNKVRFNHGVYDYDSPSGRWPSISCFNTRRRTGTLKFLGIIGLTDFIFYFSKLRIKLCLYYKLYLSDGKEHCGLSATGKKTFQNINSNKSSKMFYWIGSISIPVNIIHVLIKTLLYSDYLKFPSIFQP